MVRNFSPQIPEGIEDSAWCRVPPGSINNAEAPNCLQKSGVQGAGARHQAIPQDARGQLGAKISPTDFAEEPKMEEKCLFQTYAALLEFVELFFQGCSTSRVFFTVFYYVGAFGGFLNSLLLSLLCPV